MPVKARCVHPTFPQREKKKGSRESFTTFELVHDFYSLQITYPSLNTMFTSPFHLSRTHYSLAHIRFSAQLCLISSPYHTLSFSHLYTSLHPMLAHPFA